MSLQSQAASNDCVWEADTLACSGLPVPQKGERSVCLGDRAQVGGFQCSLCCGLTAKYILRIKNFCKQYQSL